MYDPSVVDNLNPDSQSERKRLPCPDSRLWSQINTKQACNRTRGRSGSKAGRVRDSVGAGLELNGFEWPWGVVRKIGNAAIHPHVSQAVIENDHQIAFF